jgi:hypothetical protein
MRWCARTAKSRLRPISPCRWQKNEANPGSNLPGGGVCGETLLTGSPGDLARRSCDLARDLSSALIVNGRKPGTLTQLSRQCRSLVVARNPRKDARPGEAFTLGAASSFEDHIVTWVLEAEHDFIAVQSTMALAETVGRHCVVEV